MSASADALPETRVVNDEFMVGITEGTENYCGDGSVVTGVTSFQGWVRDFCISHAIPPVGGGGAVGGGRYPSPSGPLKPAYKSAMLP